MRVGVRGASHIIRRWDAEIGGRKAQWQRARVALSPDERKRAEAIVADNVFDADRIAREPEPIAEFLSFYLENRRQIEACADERKRAHIARFEASCSTAISDECRELLERCGQGEGER